MGCQLFFVHVWLTEFHCDLQLSDRSRIVNGMQVVLVDEFLMELHCDLQL